MIEKREKLYPCAEKTFFKTLQKFFKNFSKIVQKFFKNFSKIFQKNVQKNLQNFHENQKLLAYFFNEKMFNG